MVKINNNQHITKDGVLKKNPIKDKFLRYNIEFAKMMIKETGKLMPQAMLITREGMIVVALPFSNADEKEGAKQALRHIIIEGADLQGVSLKPGDVKKYVMMLDSYLTIKTSEGITVKRDAIVINQYEKGKQPIRITIPYQRLPDGIEFGEETMFPSDDKAKELIDTWDFFNGGN